MKDIGHTDLLARYLDGKLPPEDRARVEAALETDAALRSEMEIFRQARMLAVLKADEDLAQSPGMDAYKQAFLKILEADPADFSETKESQTTSSPSQFPLAPKAKTGRRIAILLLLLAVLGVFWYLRSSRQPQVIALAYGQEKLERLARQGKKLVFSFKGNAGDSVLIAVNPGADFNTALAVYNSSGALVHFHVEESNGNLLILKGLLQQSGGYLLHVSGQPGDYRIRVDKVTPSSDSQSEQPQERATDRNNIVLDNQPTTTPDLMPSTPASAELIALAKKQVDFYFEEDFYSGGVKSGQPDEVKSTLERASEAFDSTRWEQAISLYKGVDELWDYEAEYAKLGIACFRTRRWTDAIAVFTRLSESALLPESRSKGQWYLALTYLNDIEKYRSKFDAVLDAALKNADMDDPMKARFRELDAACRKLLK